MKIVCPVPMDQCSGGIYIADDVRDKFAKCHNDYAEVLACESQCLRRQGLRQIGKREFIQDDGRILILSRRPGLRPRPGKRGADGAGTGKRIEARGIKVW